MNRTHRPGRATTKWPGRHPGEKRRAHSIRFTEAEWAGIQKAAARNGLTPAEIVRARALGLPDKPFHADMPASFSPGHVALVEATCRAVHLLAKMAKWRTMANERLYRSLMLLGALYRSELARELKGLGYGIEKTHADGRFEIAGVSRNVIETSSTVGVACRSKWVAAELPGMGVEMHKCGRGGRRVGAGACIDIMD